MAAQARRVGRFCTLRFLYRIRAYATSRRGRRSNGSSGGREATYEESLELGFHCPPRLQNRQGSTIKLGNDWYFPMLNDTHRSDFYWEMLRRRVQGKNVVDLGAGCGLLSLMAAKLGAELVVGIESSRDLAELAILNRESNGFTWDNVRFAHGNTRAIALPPEEKADVILSELFGTVMLGEGVLDVVADARRRLARPDAVVVPDRGAQFVTLISSHTLAVISGCQQAPHGLNLSAANCLADTWQIMTTKGQGLRLNTLTDVVRMSPRICVLSVDFREMLPADVPSSRTFQIRAEHDGVVHAIVTSWEVWDSEDPSLRITTHDDDTACTPWGLARDLHWGQGIQLVEDGEAAAHADRYSAPVPLRVRAGEPLQLTVTFSEPDRRMFQCRLERCRSEGRK